MHDSHNAEPVDESPEARFGAELRRLRVQAGLSVRQLADELHRAHSSIVGYEGGRRLAGVEVVEQYEDYFGLLRGTLGAQRERARAARLQSPRDATVAGHLGDVSCPYKGLRAFEHDDAALFYGREAQVQRVLVRLGEVRFVAVIGASGSGKSSFVRAGLLAGISATSANNATNERVVVLTPGEHPLDELASAISAHSADGACVLGDDLRADPDRLGRAACHADGGLVIVVDQFEELFTLGREEAERRCFIDALIGAWRDPASPVVVIVALRADFYGRVAAYPELAAAIVTHQALIGPMSTDDLRRAIELPAAQTGLLLQPGLAQTMLEDLAGEPGALPLLSHALFETWKRRQRLMLTVDGYREAGGVRGAIAQTAERTLQGLPEGDRAIARSIFLSLTDVAESSEPTRRRVDRRELPANPHNAQGLDRVLGILADARLVTIDERTVMVAHEALIRHWPRLRGWIDTDRAGLLTHRRLTDAARQWNTLQRETAALYRGARLAAAREWATDHAEQLSELERDFLTASQATEHSDLEAGKRRTRRQRLLLGGVTFAFGVSLAFAILFYVQRQTARSQVLAVRAIDATQRDPEQALKLALEASELGHSSLVMRALREAVAAAGWTRMLRGDTRRVLNDVALSPDGRLAVSGGDDGTANIWNVRTGRRIASMRHEGAIRSVRFSPDGRRIVTAGDDGTARVWDRVGHRGRELRPGGNSVHSAVFDRRGQRVITATGRGAAQVWDLTRNVPPVRLSGAGDGPLDVTSFSPNGERALTPGAAGELRVWTISPRPRFVVLRPQAGAGRSVTIATFSPDGRRVLTGDDAGTVCLWKLRRSTRPSRSCYEQANTITDASFSSDGKLFVSASAAGTAQIRSTTDSRRVAVLRHAGPVNAAAFSRVGHYVVTAGDDRLARIWTTRGRLVRVLTGHTDAVVVARFSSDGSRVLTGSDDGSARVWMTRRAVMTLPGPALPGADVAFSPDSGLLLAVDEAGHAAIWDLHRGTRSDARGAMVSNEAELAPCDHFTGCEPWSPDSRSVAGANANYKATIWDARTGAAHALHVNGATGAAFSPVRARLVLTRLQTPALIVDRAGAKQLAAVPRGSRSWVQSARFTQDGRRLLTVDVDGKVALSDASRGTSAGPRAFATIAAAATVSHDGTQLAVGTRSGSLQVHDVVNGRMRATTAQGGSITSVAFDRRGGRIVTASDDGTARVWDSQALDAPLTILRGHTEGLLTADFSPDGRFVLTTGLDRIARLFDPVLATSVIVFRTSKQGTARFSPDGRLIAIGGRHTVEVHRCELCRPFGELVGLAHARLPAD
jgi:WD40 repeat protein/transcriptional regulator with XRE-family HTH domain